MDATFADYLSTNPVVFALFGGAIGLLVGSFLNVVIHRLPIMMERDWQAQCREFVAADAEVAESEEAAPPFNLCTPGSHCPGCEHSIRAYENIPVISYLLLRGQCSNCGAKISSRYPIVEIVTALLSVATVWHFGFGWAAAAALLLTWALIALTMI
ncbi:MAG: prepilin peptidase, partial [Gammaproteobacteria bacterium]|nr:prepilin peptidase [Gammaproteobacteria bacterium]